MTTSGITRRTFGMAMTAATTGVALPAVWMARALASDAVREAFRSERWEPCAPRCLRRVNQRT